MWIFLLMAIFLNVYPFHGPELASACLSIAALGTACKEEGQILLKNLGIIYGHPLKGFVSNSKRVICRTEPSLPRTLLFLVTALSSKKNDYITSWFLHIKLIFPFFEKLVATKPKSGFDNTRN